MPPGRAALAGVVAAAAAMGAAELVAGLLAGAPSLIDAVGRIVINHQPAGAKDLAVSLFGTNDKAALEMVVVAVALGIAALLGLASRTRPAIGTGGFAAFGAAAFLAALDDPTVTPALAAFSAAVAVGVGIRVLSVLLRGAATADANGAQSQAAMPDWSRRGFLLRSAAIAAGSLAAGTAGRLLIASRTETPAIAERIPPASVTASLPSGAAFQTPGISPIVVPNPDFYRIDTALLVPTVDASRWSLRVTGMVDRQVSLTFAELIAMPLVEQYVTIACVSNQVGGNLVGNAKWTGVRLRDVLAMAGVQAGATQLVGRSVDGWTAGAPTEWVMDPAREPLIAVMMNDAALPREHGYPARLIIPGLYGYVSATKWLTELQLTTLEAFDAYWIPLGWAKEGPILTQSRIDVPHDGQALPAGPAVIAGVAWAPDRGITKVEVAVDGAWQTAAISTPISKTTWVQWRLDWQAARGSHTIEVRATDGTGAVQTADRSQPAPDGARGHHTISVTVG